MPECPEAPLQRPQPLKVLSTVCAVDETTALGLQDLIRRRLLRHLNRVLVKGRRASTKLGFGLGLITCQENPVARQAERVPRFRSGSLSLPASREDIVLAEGTTGSAAGVSGDVCLLPSGLCPTSRIGTWSDCRWDSGSCFMSR